MSGQALLGVSDINVSYGAAQALWDVSFSVKRGELVVLVGSNGAGKTTSLRCVQGVLRPSTGKVTFNSKDITGMSANRVTALGLSLVPEGRGLFATMTVEENLQLGAFNKRARRRMKENFDTAFELFPVLKERRQQRAGSLSGGEQQMLAIGRGLMSEPEMLMLDEPSLGLAPMVVSKVFKVLQELKQRGLTILLVEQNVEASLSIADRGYLLDTGRIAFEGRPEEFRENKSLKESYLGL
ncbi:MAG: ABC transporter ATP-binding protein [Nitrososphaerales archaeon]|nr:ABC transporter ATP-binding protein [Nitrososphaerales archaeon]